MLLVRPAQPGLTSRVPGIDKLSLRPPFGGLPCELRARLRLGGLRILTCELSERAGCPSHIIPACSGPPVRTERHDVFTLQRCALAH
jgi:hypothetical protein